MTALPSFVELMASLGLETHHDATQSSSPISSPTCSPRLSVTAASPNRIRSRSNPVLRESASATRLRNARYSPYAPSIAGRRGSTSSTSSASDVEPSNRASSSSPRPRQMRRVASAHLTVNIFDSVSDLSANTPISSYVRRKTPVASPTSPTFSSTESIPTDSPSHSPMPFSIPTLPNLFPRSPTLDSNFPVTPDATMEVTPLTDLDPPRGKESPESFDIRRRHAAVRISTPPRCAPDTTAHSRGSR